MVKSPVLILAGEDDPVRSLQVAGDLASRLPADTTQLVRLPGARHHIFRDRPDPAFPAAEDFIRRIAAGERASAANPSPIGTASPAAADRPPERA